MSSGKCGVFKCERRSSRTDNCILSDDNRLRHRSPLCLRLSARSGWQTTKVATVSESYLVACVHQFSLHRANVHTAKISLTNWQQLVGCLKTAVLKLFRFKTRLIWLEAPSFFLFHDCRKKRRTILRLLRTQKDHTGLEYF